MDWLCEYDLAAGRMSAIDKKVVFEKAQENLKQQRQSSVMGNRVWSVAEELAAVVIKPCCRRESTLIWEPATRRLLQAIG